MAIIEISDLDDPRVTDYRNVKDRDLRLARESFMVEGAENLRALLGPSQFEPRSLLLNPRATRSLAPELEALPPDLPVYVAERDVYEGIVGFDLHRGCLAACPRPADLDPARLLDKTVPAVTPHLVVTEGITNLDNMGALFRNALAFGAKGILLCPSSCDPLYRKAIRTSMGASLIVPFARAEIFSDALAALKSSGYRIIGLHPAASGLELLDLTLDARPIALVVGTEGPGLSQGALDHCDDRARIAMAPGMDSINVGLAAGIALHRLFSMRDLGKGVE